MDTRWEHKQKKVVGIDAIVEVMTGRSCSLGVAEEQGTLPPRLAKTACGVFISWQAKWNFTWRK